MEVSSSVVRIQAIVSADVILPDSGSKLWLLVVHLATVMDGQLVTSPPPTVAIPKP